MTNSNILISSYFVHFCHQRANVREEDLPSFLATPCDYWWSVKRDASLHYPDQTLVNLTPSKNIWPAPLGTALARLDWQWEAILAMHCWQRAMGGWIGIIKLAMHNWQRFLFSKGEFIFSSWQNFFFVSSHVSQSYQGSG